VAGKWSKDVSVCGSVDRSDTPEFASGTVLSEHEGYLEVVHMQSKACRRLAPPLHHFSKAARPSSRPSQTRARDLALQGSNHPSGTISIAKSCIFNVYELIIR
jgi:hypothetical protein